MSWHTFKRVLQGTLISTTLISALSFDEYWNQVVETNPFSKSFDSKKEALVYQDQSLTRFGQLNFDFESTSFGTRENEISLGQEIDLTSKIIGEKALLSIRKDQINLESKWWELGFKTTLKKLWLEVNSLEKQQVIYLAHITEHQELKNWQTLQISRGAGSLLDFNQTEIKMIEMQSEAEIIQLEIASLKKSLNLYAGMNGFEESVLDSLPNDVMSESHLKSDLLKSKIKLAEGESNLFKSTKIPSVYWGAGIKQDVIEKKFYPQMALGFSFDIHSTAKFVESQKLKELEGLQYRFKQNQIELEVQQLKSQNQLKRIETKLTQIRDKLLPRTVKQISLALSKYKSGTLTYQVVLDQYDLMFNYEIEEIKNELDKKLIKLELEMTR